MTLPTNYIELKDFLDHKVASYNQPDFIENDPICIPHQFSKLQDIEIREVTTLEGLKDLKISLKIHQKCYLILKLNH